MYLMATYGEGKYVETHHNQQIYLNHKLLEKKELNLTEIQQKSAEFLMQFSGVNEAYSANRLLLGSWTPEIYKIRNGYHRKRSGDLVIDVLPGWTIVNENGGENKVVRHSYIPSPLIFMGHSVKPAVIHTCNNRPYRAYTGTFYAHPGSQRLHICSYYRPAVKETSQKQGAKHK